MSQEINCIVHAIAEDGLPNMDGLTGRVALIFDGCVISGWPLPHDLWEADSDVGHTRPFGGVTHWIEFPVPVWNLERPAASVSTEPATNQEGQP